MSKTTIPGGAVCHKIITDECRRNRGPIGAVDTALMAVRDSIGRLFLQCPPGAGWEFHVVLTCVRPTRPNDAEIRDAGDRRAE